MLHIVTTKHLKRFFTRTLYYKQRYFSTMAEYIKCKQENGFFQFDTIEKYPENIANEILEAFISQDLEAITYKTADDHEFSVTGRIREQFVQLLLDDDHTGPVLAKTNNIKNNLDYKVQKLLEDHVD